MLPGGEIESICSKDISVITEMLNDQRIPR